MRHVATRRRWRRSPRDTTLQQFEAPNGDRIELPAEGALIPQSLAKILGAGVGDQIEVTLPGAGVPPFKVPVAALTSNTLGNLVFLSNDALPQRDGRGRRRVRGRLVRHRVGPVRAGRRRGEGGSRGAGEAGGRGLRAGGRQPQHRRPGATRSSRPSSRPCSPSPPSSPCWAWRSRWCCTRGRGRVSAAGA